MRLSLPGAAPPSAAAAPSCETRSPAPGAPAAPRHLLARRAAALLAPAVLAGCASFSDDGGFGPVDQLAKAHGATALQWARSEGERTRLDERVAALLARPLTADDAAQVALFNNRALQAAFFELGISEAEMVQAGRLPNPGLSFGRLRRGDELEIDRTLQFDLASLVAMPLRLRAASQRFAVTQSRVAQSALALANDTRKAQVDAVAAAQSAHYAAQVLEAAEAGAELARRMAEAGNWSALARSREQAFHDDAIVDLARAEQASVAARERLTRLMGLGGRGGREGLGGLDGSIGSIGSIGPADAAQPQVDFTLPERLNDLPAAVEAWPDIERRAMAQRLDIRTAHQRLEQLASDLGLTRVTRFVDGLELGLVRNSSSIEGPQRGAEIGFEIPLFDWSGARVKRAEAVYLQSANQAAQAAVEARSEVRLAYARYRSAFDVARHYRDQVVPTRQRIAEQTLLRYNGMLASVFDLLADARAQIGSVDGAIAALRDFWLARAELDQALIGTPSALAAPAAP